MSEVIADAKETVEDLCKAAFQAGLREGRAQTIRQFQERFAGLFDADAPSTKPPVEPNGEPDGRAAPGSVKPVIQKMLVDTVTGLTPALIAERTGFKFNSVRGTLWTLGKEGFAVSNDGRWFAAAKKDEGSPSEPKKEPSVVE